MAQIASGISFMHSRGVIHRDLKPENLIQSLENPSLWKLADFGISVLTSGYMMATRDHRGTDQYTAPEILHAQPGVPTYWNAVDIYGIGLMLYELFTGHRVFNSRPEAMIFPPRIPQVYYSPQVPLPHGFHQVVDMASAYATRIVFTPLDHIDDCVRAQLAEFWDAVRGMELTDLRLFGEVNFGFESRLEEINKFLRAILDCDPKKRPEIQVLEHHFRANVVRSMLENDVV